VAVTPPYLHDGSAKRLEDVVTVMARFQLGKKIDQDEITKIVAFLRTLTGQYLGKTLE
jgi:cytochrome c peroxidase